MLRKITLRVAPERFDAALDRALAMLPLGVHVVEGDDATVLIALGEPHQLSTAEELAAALGDMLLEPPVDEEAGDLHDELDRLRPSFEIGGRVLVRPPRVPAPDPASGLVDVVIARAAGFGTGAHPSTRMSLELMLGVEPAGSFADLGCGAGVLVIAAAKLGWEPVTGLDFSEHGVTEARANAERNGVTATFEHADLRSAALPVVRTAVANVSEGDVHVRLAAHDWDGLETLIVAGLRTGRDLEQALERYGAAGFTEHDRREYGQWAAVLLRPAS